LKRVIGADRAIAPILDLLQNRIRGAVGKDIAGDRQDRQAVYMRQAAAVTRLSAPGPIDVD
jgi:hypothetical protein